jgi:uncharacterized membrane protein
MRSLSAICIASGVVTLASAGVVNSQSQGGAAPRSVILATYAGQDRAAEVFKTMQSAQAETGERIEAYAIVSKDASGNTTVRDQRRTGTGVGAVVGGIIGLLGGPVGVAVGAAAGGAAGYLTGKAVGIPQETVATMKESLTPDSSAFIAVIEKRWVQDIERSLRQAQARQVIASDIAAR